VPDPGPSNGVRGRLDAIPASLWHAVVAVALVAVLVGVVVVEVTGTSDRNSGRAVPRLARTKGPAGVAAAYGYPLRCLSVTIPADHRDYARADFSRTFALRPLHLGADGDLPPVRGRLVPGAGRRSVPVPGRLDADDRAGAARRVSVEARAWPGSISGRSVPSNTGASP